MEPADIILKPDAAKAYREAEAALAKAKEKNPTWSTDKDWICDNKSSAFHSALPASLHSSE